MVEKNEQARHVSTRQAIFALARLFVVRTGVPNDKTFQIPTIPERKRETARSLMLILELG